MTAMTEDTSKIWRAQVRLPAPVIEWVRQKAGQNFRSVNAELVAVLRQAMQSTHQG